MFKQRISAAFAVLAGKPVDNVQEEKVRVPVRVDRSGEYLRVTVGDAPDLYINDSTLRELSPFNLDLSSNKVVLQQKGSTKSIVVETPDSTSAANLHKKLKWDLDRKLRVQGIVFWAGLTAFLLIVLTEIVSGSGKAPTPPVAQTDPGKWPALEQKANDGQFGLKEAFPTSLEGTPAVVDMKVVRGTHGFPFTVAAGTNAHEIWVFSDPFCEACNYFERELMGLTGVTVHYVPTPIKGVPSANATLQVLCRDPNQRLGAWKAITQAGSVGEDGLSQQQRVQCAELVRTNLTAFQTLGFRGTPTIVSKDGRTFGGSLSKAQLLDWLNKK